MKSEDLVNRVDEILGMGSKALSTKQSSQYRSEHLDAGAMRGFRAASLSFIDLVYGSDHSHFKEFQHNTNGCSPDAAESGIGILRAIRTEIDGGWLSTLKGLITAKVFADFIEMAEHLLETGYKDPAAVMCGSVLEEHLRQLCTKNGISTHIDKNDKQIPKRADGLNSELTKDEVYSKLDQKMVTAWLDLRNRAAHGQYSEYTDDQLKNTLSAVTDFMARVAV